MKNETVTIGKRFLSIAEFMSYTGLGRNNAIKLGEEIGCRVRMGHRILFDLKIADEYFDKLSGRK